MFSIVTPNYNSENFIKAALNSVLEQTYVDWELIVIDDGSTDSGIDIIKSFQEKDKRVKLFLQENCGVSIARNKGVAMSNYEYIAFLDSDDLWHPDKLQKAYDLLSADSKIHFLYSRCQFISTDGKKLLTKSRNAVDIKNLNLIIGENITTTTSSWIVRKSSFVGIKGFNSNMSYAEDLDLLIRWRLQIPGKMVGVNLCHTYYRTNPRGLSSDIAKMEDGWNTLEQNLKKLLKPINENFINYGSSCHYLYLARRALRCGLSGREVVQYFLRSVIRYPLILVIKPTNILKLITLLIIYTLHVNRYFR